MSSYHVSDEDRKTEAGNVVKVYTEAETAAEAEGLAAKRGPEATIIVFESIDELKGVRPIDPASTEAMLETMESRLASSPSLGREIVTEIEEAWNELQRVQDSEDDDLVKSVQEELEGLLLYRGDPALPVLIRLALKGVR